MAELIKFTFSTKPQHQLVQKFQKFVFYKASKSPISTRETFKKYAQNIIRPQR